MLVFGETVLLLTRGHPLGGHRDVGITRELGPRVHEVLDRLCALSGQPRPELRLLNLRHANALTLTGRGGRGVIYLTPRPATGLETPELEAVLAHEMAHIAHRDERLMVFAIGMTQWALHLPWLIMPFTDWLNARINAFARRCGHDWVWFTERGEEEKEPLGEIRNPVLRVLAYPLLWALAFVNTCGVLFLLLAVKLPLLALGALIALPGLPAAYLLNRQRELAADRAAAELIGAPSTLASALNRLREHRDGTPMRDLRAAGVSGPAIIPVNGKDGGGWFSTHPPLAKRMDRLRAQARDLARSGR
jgi:heat shock protein HtpX